MEKDRAQSAERIHTLHTRLHQEAEKIRKWKTSTEIEIKEKVRIFVIILLFFCLVSTSFDTAKGNPFFQVISEPFNFPPFIGEKTTGSCPNNRFSEKVYPGFTG